LVFRSVRFRRSPLLSSARAIQTRESCTECGYCDSTRTSLPSLSDTGRIEPHASKSCSAKRGSEFTYVLDTKK
ncbi:hypothetical protein ANCDUO_17693, partial [Ancylostoma duodenale]